jgi:hypothetical protein
MAGFASGNREAVCDAIRREAATIAKRAALPHGDAGLTAEFSVGFSITAFPSTRISHRPRRRPDRAPRNISLLPQ